MNFNAPSIVFDLDGTLIDSRKDLASAVNITRSHFDLPPLSLDEVVSYIGDGAPLLLSRSTQDAPHLSTETLLPIFKKAYKDHLRVHTFLYDGAIDGIKKLHTHGYQLALFSNKPHAACLELMEVFGFLPYLSLIIGAGDAFPLKPSGAALTHILKTNHSDPKKSFMVGDHHTDIHAAKDAQMKSIFALWGFGDKGDTKPTFQAHNFSECVEIILANR